MTFSVRPFFVILCISLAAATAGAGATSTLQVGASLLSHGLNRTTQKASGDTSLLGSTYYQFYFQNHFAINGPWQFSPNVSYMHDSILPTPSAGGTSKNTYFILGLPVTYQLNDRWELAGGPAFLWYTIKGEGGTTTLNNGTGTATFAKPGQSSTSTTLALTFGGGWNWAAGRVGTDFVVEGFTNTQKKTYSLLVSASFNAWSYGGGSRPARSAPSRSKR